MLSGKLKRLTGDFKQFSGELSLFLTNFGLACVFHIDKRKSKFVSSLYRQRGKKATRLIHSGMAGITAFGVMVAPIVADELPNNDTLNPWEAPSPSSVLSASTQAVQTAISDRQFRDSIIEYEVEEGDTLSTIASKFDIDTDTLRWQNDLGISDTIKPGQKLEVLPVSGLAHKVKKGDTVFSIAKKYDIDAQAIVNYPFNSYVNDETFELAIGQTLIAPGGVLPNVAPTTPRIRQITPNAGTVVASGNFVWPTQGTISQNFVWYHTGIDIANKSAPNVVAADSGSVVVAGWPDNYGYGNRVVIDHGNGMRTLYAHLSRIYVVPGQTVSRGSAIGQMGSTGRSTGTHLHFEVIRSGVKINPLSVLQ